MKTLENDAEYFWLGEVIYKVYNKLFGNTEYSGTFSTWIKILSKELEFLVYNPFKDVVKKTLPAKFKKPVYLNVQHIDCTEIFIETQQSEQLLGQTINIITLRKH